MQILRTLLVGLSFILVLGVSCFAQNTSGETGAKAGAPKPNAHIKTKYNQSKNETTVTLKTMALSNAMNKEFSRESEFGQLDLDVFFTYPGQQLTRRAEMVTLKFKGTTKNQLWQKDQNLIGVIDDQSALMLGVAKYSSTSQTFYFEEFLTIAIPFEAMQRIASAKTFAFQLGTRAVKVKEDQLEDLRAMASRMAP